MFFHLIFTFFFIASAFIVNKLIVGFVHPDIFVFLRMFISGLIIIAIFCRDRAIILNAQKHILKLLFISAFTTFIPSLLRAYALTMISASRVSFWGAFEPFITSIYMYILYNQKLTKNQIIGCIIGIFASLIFIFTQSKFDINFQNCIICLGDILQILTITISRYGWIKAQEILKKNEFSPIQLNGFTFTISGISALIYSFFNGTISSISSINLNFNLFFLFFYTIVLGNILAYWLYAFALKKYNVTLVSLAGLSTPLFVHLSGPIIFGEPISKYFFVSMSFLAIGLYIFYKKS